MSAFNYEQSMDSPRYAGQPHSHSAESDRFQVLVHLEFRYSSPASLSDPFQRHAIWPTSLMHEKRIVQPVTCCCSHFHSTSQSGSDLMSGIEFQQNENAEHLGRKPCEQDKYAGLSRPCYPVVASGRRHGHRLCEQGGEVAHGV
jgi:hypothetical protein